MKLSKLQTTIENGTVPIFVCFDTDTKDIVCIWEESPDRLQYRTDDGWHSTNDNLIRYRFPGQGTWLNETQRSVIYRMAQEMMKGCSQKNKTKGEYLIEKMCPIKMWIELQDKKAKYEK